MKLCKKLEKAHKTIHQRKDYDKAPVIKGKKLTARAPENTGKNGMYIILWELVGWFAEYYKVKIKINKKSYD